MIVDMQKGFTIIEIAIVTGLMALLVAVLAPQLINFNQRRLVTEDARTIENGIRVAQTLADSGVKSPSGGTDAYRFSLLKGTGDTGNCYRGYQVVAVNNTTAPILPTLEQKGLTCGVVMYSTWSQIFYQSESGKLITLDGITPKTVNICYPGKGFVPITIDAAGKIMRGEFNPTIGANCSTCTTACRALIP